MRDRLTYSNVVATLALFIALGGTGYAAATITSSDIKNRTIKGGDVKKNALGGTEINERKLRQVPSARRAATAGSADISKNADVATQAGNSLTADLANVARDANTLAGQGAAAFEQSSTVQFGKAPANPAGTGAEQAVLSWPELGVEVTSASGAACADPDEIKLGVRNTKSSGPSALLFIGGQDAAEGTAPPGGSTRPCIPTGANAQVADSSGRVLFIHCRNFGDELRCLGVRGE